MAVFENWQTPNQWQTPGKGLVLGGDDRSGGRPQVVPPQSTGVGRLSFFQRVLERSPYFTTHPCVYIYILYEHTTFSSSASNLHLCRCVAIMIKTFRNLRISTSCHVLVSLLGKASLALPSICGSKSISQPFLPQLALLHGQ